MIAARLCRILEARLFVTEDQTGEENGASRSRKSSSSITGEFLKKACRKLHPDLVGVGIVLVGGRRYRRHCGRSPDSRPSSCRASDWRNIDLSRRAYQRKTWVRLPSKDVVGDDVAAQFAGELDGDAVVGEAVARMNQMVLSGWKGERSEPTPMAQVDDFVVLDHDVRRLLEAERHAGGAGGV
jgi:hypothetical protein